MTEKEKEALERRIDELCQENERLRKQLHDQQDTAEHNFVRNAREYKRVCDENAKLREYVAWFEEAVIESSHVPSQTKTWLNAKRFELGILSSESR